MIAQQCNFPYTKTILESLETTLSPGRLALYERLAGGTSEDALRLYCWNMGLSQVLYWPLHAFEVSLRNAMADRIADEYGDDWYERIVSFSTSRSPKPNDEAAHVEKAKRKLDEEGLAYGHDNIVAAISLGFWQGLLKLEYRDRLWDPLFSKIFQMIDREEAYKKVNQIKRLRNNVAHYEPVLVFLPRGDKRELFKDYKVVLKMIRWICPDTAHWVEYHCSADFFAAWNSCPAAFGMPKLSVTSAGEEANSHLWKFQTT